MDSNGNTVNDEKESFGYKVTHTVSHPNMIFCMDKVASDTSQKVYSTVRVTDFLMTRWEHTKGKMINQFKALGVT